MKTLKRMNILVIPMMLAAMALPAVTYARVEEGAGVMMVSVEQHITGNLQEIGSGYVNVGGETITVDMSTEMQYPLSVGDVVEVSARVDNQGNLVAREIGPTSTNAMDDHSQDRITSGQDDSSSSDSSQDRITSGQDDSSSHDSQDDNSSNSSQDSSNSGRDDSSSHDSPDDNSSNSGQDDRNNNSGQDDSSNSSQGDNSSNSGQDDSSNSSQDDNSGHDSHDNSGSNSGQDSGSHDSHDD
jgi:hypothetical protein